jgi:hypothetical protein
MTTYVPARLIKELEEALNNSVPARRHNDVLAALKRCQELIGNLAATVADLDKSHRHGELMIEAKLYANVLAGFFDDAKSDWYDLAKGYNPRDYLTDKGAIKSTNPTRVQMEERFVAERKAKKDEIDRLLSDLEWKRAKRKLKQAQRNIGEVVKPVIEVGPAHEYINKLRAEHGRGPIKPASKRGRPAGSKNKPKEVINLPTLEESPGKKVGILKRIKKLQAASTKKGGRK